MTTNNTHKNNNTGQQRWVGGLFHFVNSKSNLSIPIQFLLTPITQITYLEYLLRVVYIPSRLVMEEIFMN